MMLTVAVASHKGGVGKTTMLVNLAVALASRDIDTLVVDMDTQGHVATYLGAERTDDAYRLLAESDPQNAYTGLTPAHELVTRGVRPHLDMVAGGPRTGLAEPVLTERLGRERVLKRRLKELADDYAVCLVDVPPGFSVISSVALYAADGVLIPATPGSGPESGVLDLLSRLEALEREVDYAPQLLGVVPNMVDRREKESRALLDFAEQHKHGPAIRKAVSMPAATRQGKAISEFDAGCDVANDYGQLGEWAAQEIGALI